MSKLKFKKDDMSWVFYWGRLFVRIYYDRSMWLDKWVKVDGLIIAPWFTINWY